MDITPTWRFAPPEAERVLMNRTGDASAGCQGVRDPIMEGDWPMWAATLQLHRNSAASRALGADPARNLDRCQLPWLVYVDVNVEFGACASNRIDLFRG